MGICAVDRCRDRAPPCLGDNHREIMGLPSSALWCAREQTCANRLERRRVPVWCSNDEGQYRCLGIEDHAVFAGDPEFCEGCGFHVPKTCYG